MTTIAFDGRLMAADTLAVDGMGLKVPGTAKIFPFTAGGGHFLIGVAGVYGTALVVVDALQGWLADGKPVAKFSFKDCDENCDVSLMVAWSQRRRPFMMYRVGHGFRPPGTRKYHALGTGRDYALMAMRLGKTAPEAVRLAMEFDSGTGGPIRTYTLFE